jgi:hypothetical protein
MTSNLYKMVIMKLFLHTIPKVENKYEYHEAEGRLHASNGKKTRTEEKQVPKGMSQLFRQRWGHFVL